MRSETIESEKRRVKHTVMDIMEGNSDRACLGYAIITNNG